MLRGGVQHVIGMVCVLFAVLNASVSRAVCCVGCECESYCSLC